MHAICNVGQIYYVTFPGRGVASCMLYAKGFGHIYFVIFQGRMMAS